MDHRGRDVITVLDIDHVVLRTMQPQAMLGFYRDVLGCTVERELSPSVGLIQLRAGRALIDIVPADSQLGRAGGGEPDPQHRNLDHLCLRIAPVPRSELLAWLSSHGIGVGDFERRYGATGFAPSLYLADPDGNTVELRVAGTEEA